MGVGVVGQNGPTATLSVEQEVSLAPAAVWGERSEENHALALTETLECASDNVHAKVREKVGSEKVHSSFFRCERLSDIQSK